MAEDEDLVRASLEVTLTSAGYTVLEARDGVEALEVCQREGASIDMLVTDVVMPKMTGLELARRLAVDHPELKVLCLSGYSAEAISDPTADRVAVPGQAVPAGDAARAGPGSTRLRGCQAVRLKADTTYIWKPFD